MIINNKGSTSTLLNWIGGNLMDKDNKKQNTPPKQSDRAGAGGGNFEKRSNEPLKKNYRNHNQEHILPSESRLEQMFRDDYKKDRK